MKMDKKMADATVGKDIPDGAAQVAPGQNVGNQDMAIKPMVPTMLKPKIKIKKKIRSIQDLKDAAKQMAPKKMGY